MNNIPNLAVVVLILSTVLVPPVEAQKPSANFEEVSLGGSYHLIIGAAAFDAAT
jgi:hypothetical protein